MEMEKRPEKLRRTERDNNNIATTTEAEAETSTMMTLLTTPENTTDQLNRDDDEQQQKPPTLNDLILKNLFQISSHRELNRYRLVCKPWYKTSLPQWLSGGPPIVVKGEDKLNKFISQVYLQRAGGDNKHGEGDIVGIQGYPKFHLKPRHHDGFLYDVQQFQAFWTHCGPHLTHLKLEGVIFPDVLSLRNVLLSNWTPNLTCLDVDVASIVGRVEVEFPPELQSPGENKNLKTFRINVRKHLVYPFPLDWKIIFRRYPNLKNLAIGYYLSWLYPEWNSPHSFQMTRIMQAITEIRNEDEEKLDLTSLEWFCTENYKEYHVTPNRESGLPHVIPQLLHQAQLKLKTFRLDFDIEDSDELVHNLLMLYADTLTKLEIRFRLLFLEYPFSGLNKLQSLTLTGYPVDNLTFLQDLPALRSLRLWGSISEFCAYGDSLVSLISSTHQSGDMEGVTFPSLTEFCCNYQVDWTEEDVTLLRSWIPNLKRLEMVLDNASFRTVCHCWPALEHLSVYGAKVGDKGIVGLAWEGEKIVYQKPNITSLKQLKSFAIENLGLHSPLYDGDFTQHSVFYGFLKLPQLERLVIQAYKINPDVKMLILERFPFAKVIVGRGCFKLRWTKNPKFCPPII